MNPDGREGEEKLHIVQWTENITVLYYTRKGSIFNKRGKEQNIKKTREPNGEKVKLKFSGMTVVQAETAKPSVASLSLKPNDNNPSPHSQTQGTQPWAEFTQLLRQCHSLLSWNFLFASQSLSLLFHIWQKTQSLPTTCWKVFLLLLQNVGGLLGMGQQ